LDTPKPISGEIGIDASDFKTANVLFFDRYRIEPHSNFFELQFGFYGQASDVRSGLIVVISREAVAEAQKAYCSIFNSLERCLSRASYQSAISVPKQKW
jgi:hypothetical protein